MKATFAATVFHVSSTENALEFYTETLGFDPAFKVGDYAGICSGEVNIHLCGPNNGGYKKPIGAGHLCLLVEEIDIYYHKLIDLGVAITYPIGDRDYGIRDFAIEDPDGNTLIFGEAIGPA